MNLTYWLLNVWNRYIPVPRESPANNSAPVSLEVTELLAERCHSTATTVTDRITPQSTKLRERYLSTVYDPTAGIKAVTSVSCTAQITRERLTQRPRFVGVDCVAGPNQQSCRFAAGCWLVSSGRCRPSCRPKDRSSYSVGEYSTNLIAASESCAEYRGSIQHFGSAYGAGHTVYSLN